MRRWFIIYIWYNGIKEAVEDQVNADGCFKEKRFGTIEDAKLFGERFDRHEIFEYTVLKVWEHHTVEKGRE